MTDWHKVTLDEVPELQAEIVSVVEVVTDHGRTRLDAEDFLDRLELSEPGRDLGTDMQSPVVRAIMRRARKVYRELREAQQ